MRAVRVNQDAVLVDRVIGIAADVWSLVEHDHGYALSSEPLCYHRA
jgi:hypothetical protein